MSSWHSSYIQSLNNWKSESLNQLFNADLNKIDDTWKNLMSDLQQERIQPSIEISSQEQLKKYYFVDHDNVEIFLQWESNTGLDFENKREKHLKKVEEEYRMIYRVQKTKKKMDDIFVNYRKDIVSKVLALFTDMKRRGESINDKFLVDSKFKTIWSEWKSQIEVTAAPEFSDISTDLQSALLESEIIKSMHVLPEKSILINKTEDFIAMGQESFQNLSNLRSDTDTKSSYFTFYDLFNFGIWCISTIFPGNIKASPGSSQFNNLLGILSTECERKINDYLSSLLNNESPYDLNSFHIIINQCYETSIKQNSSQKYSSKRSLELKTDFIFDFIFYECCKAIPTLQHIQERFISRTNLDAKFNQLEDKLKFTFNQLCEGIESEYLCASELAKITMSGLKDCLADFVPKVFLSIFMNDSKNKSTYSDRPSLILTVLKDLARKRMFDEYLSYVENPINFLLDYAQKQLQIFLTREDVIKTTKRKVLEEVNMLTEFFSEVCNEVSTEEYNEIPITWMRFKKQFYSQIKLKIRNVSYNDLDVLDIHKISDYSQFCHLYGEELKRLVQETEWTDWIVSIIEKEVSLYKTITDPILECEELCPFCNELCQLSCGTHEHYCGTFHRPQGINGWRGYHDKKISLHSCTSCIKWKTQFYINDVQYNYVDYKTVNSRFRSWKILGEDALESKYWNWVLYHFEDEFVAHYEILKNEFTSQWSNLTGEEVIKDLENHYRNHIFRKD